MQAKQKHLRTTNKLLDGNPAHPPPLLGISIAATGIGSETALTGAHGLIGYGIDIFAIDILSVADKGASAVARACISLFEAEELQLLLQQVEDVPAHVGKNCFAGSGVRESLWRLGEGRESWGRMSRGVL